MLKPILISITFLFFSNSFQTSKPYIKSSFKDINSIRLNNNLPSNDYSQIFGNDYTDALNYFRENNELHKKIFDKHKVDAEIIIPVLFPERIRYSIVRDYFETVFLETIYADLGSEYVDFSIGDFQMKPSFIEKLELFIENSEMLSSKYTFLLINEIESKQVRKERLKRIKSVAYQLNYICAFYDIIKQRFDLSEISKTEKIRFVASAYNFGFDKSKDDIIKKQGLKVFPYGSKYPGKQYAYTDVSVDFYTNHYTQIFKAKTKLK